jgi:DNA-directed RNA polymerase subunit RPC12/RpoP
MTQFQEVECPNCGYIGTAMTVEYNGKQVVFDACNKCGTKLTDWQEV